MIVIGLAGESGTGKTTLAQHLIRNDGVHVDTDRLGHEILVDDASVVAAVAALVGGDVLNEAGRIDRRILGARVFADPDLLERYGAIIHPAIRDRSVAMIEKARQEGKRIAVVDGALLLTTKMEYPIEIMYALRCDPEEQRRRLRRKGGWSDDEIEARLKNQDHIQKSFYKADHVIDTDGNIDDIVSAIEATLPDDGTA